MWNSLPCLLFSLNQCKVGFNSKVDLTEFLHFLLLSIFTWNQRLVRYSFWDEKYLAWDWFDRIFAQNEVKWAKWKAKYSQLKNSFKNFVKTIREVAVLNYIFNQFHEIFCKYTLLCSCLESTVVLMFTKYYVKLQINFYIRTGLRASRSILGRKST